MRYVCTRTCTDFSGRFWETGSIVEFTDGERVPKWFSPFDPQPLPVSDVPGPGEAVAMPEPEPAPEPPKPQRGKGKK